jgi:predicted outer membrane repeat protein
MYFKNNITTGNGGAIENHGKTTLFRCDVIENWATGDGGGIYNGETATLRLTQNKETPEFWALVPPMSASF